MKNANVELAEKIEGLREEIDPVLDDILNIIKAHGITNGYLCISMNANGCYRVSPDGNGWCISQSRSDHPAEISYTAR